LASENCNHGADEEITGTVHECDRRTDRFTMTKTALCMASCGEKEHTALHGKPISELPDVTGYRGSHSVSCHPTQVNAPHLNPSRVVIHNGRPNVIV